MKTHQPATAIAQSDHSSNSNMCFAPPAFNLTAGNAVVQRQVDADTCGASNPRWDAFALEFNEHFQSVLHAFPQTPVAASMPDTPPTASPAAAPEAESATPSVEAPTAESTSEPTAEAPAKAPVPVDASPAKISKKLGGQSGAHVSGETLSCLFTVQQREMLLHFFNDNIIPERLFNGDEVGGSTAQQRILMSGIILKKGKYAPGSFYQRVHARMCGHWVKLVWHYAGVTPYGNSEWARPDGNLDHDGNIVIGNGKHEMDFVGRKDREYIMDQPEVLREYMAPEGTNFRKGFDKAGDSKKEKYQRF
ncbi:MAG: hypothetical protein AAF570_16715, partial [Bacteroidota bacterium]